MNRRAREALRHGCEVCTRGQYIDEAHNHVTWCGRVFAPWVRNCADGDGLAAMKGCDCAECLINFDAWASTQTAEGADWNR